MRHLDDILFSRRLRGMREPDPMARLALMAAYDVELPPNSTGTSVETVAGVGGTKARQVAALGSPTTAANYLEMTARFAALIEGPTAAAVAVAANPVPIGVDDGTLVRALKSAGAAILAALSSAGALLCAQPGQWAINHTPATATQATITRAAGAAGVRHVCTGLQFSVAVDGTNAQTNIKVNLRDGATGAGTILWSTTILMAATEAEKFFSVTGLNIVGTAATAMTLEFSAAGVTGSLQSVALQGYDTPAA